jgi:hypothetical protein
MGSSPTVDLVSGISRFMEDDFSIIWSGPASAGSTRPRMDASPAPKGEAVFRVAAILISPN